MHKPLSQQAVGTPDFLALSLVERPPVGMINLRGPSADPAFTDAVAKILGQKPPTVPNRFVARDDMQCIWQGPDEWLIVVPDGRQQGLVERLDVALSELHHAVTDVTGNRIVFRLNGRYAATLLASGSSLDFADPSFPRGTAAQTLLARTPVTIMRVDDTPSFEIHARRSYRVWLRDWLLHSAGTVDAP